MIGIIYLICEGRGCIMKKLRISMNIDNKGLGDYVFTRDGIVYPFYDICPMVICDDVSAVILTPNSSESMGENGNHFFITKQFDKPIESGFGKGMTNDYIFDFVNVWEIYK